MKESFWKGNGKNAWAAKAVISSTGHAVAKNYRTDGEDRESLLRFGDIGITMRLDRKLDGMTPEQRLAAQDLAQAMFTDLMRTLGKEVIEGSGIPVGSYIQCGEAVHRVEKETKLGLHLRSLNGGFLSTTTFATWEKLGYFAILQPNDLKGAINSSFSTRLWGYNLNAIITSTRTDDFRKFANSWGEDQLTLFFLHTRVNQERRWLDDGRVDSKQQDWLRPALEVIHNSTNLQRIADQAQNQMVREAASLLLLDRAQASAATPDP